MNALVKRSLDTAKNRSMTPILHYFHTCAIVKDSLPFACFTITEMPHGNNTQNLKQSNHIRNYTFLKY